jgi:hypothetical protein
LREKLNFLIAQVVGGVGLYLFTKRKDHVKAAGKKTEAVSDG